MWTSKNRARYDRSKLRYPSDLTDDEWGLVKPLIAPGKTGGGKRTVIMREVVNGLMYVLSTGCQWRAIPKDLPPGERVPGDLPQIEGALCAAARAVHVEHGVPAISAARIVGAHSIPRPAASRSFQRS